MSKWSKLFAIALLVVGLNTGVTLAQNNAPGDNEAQAESDTGADGLLVFDLTCRTRNCVFSFLCTGGSPICVRVADLFLFGDVWRATISRTNGSDPDSCSNQNARGAVFFPGFFSSRKCTASATAIIHVSPGNSIPAGLPAGLRVEIANSVFSPLFCSVFVDQSF